MVILSFSKLGAAGARTSVSVCFVKYSETKYFKWVFVFRIFVASVAVSGARFMAEPGTQWVGAGLGGGTAVRPTVTAPAVSSSLCPQNYVRAKPVRTTDTAHKTGQNRQLN